MGQDEKAWGAANATLQLHVSQRHGRDPVQFADRIFHMPTAIVFKVEDLLDLAQALILTSA
jgi:hypothetical protein